MGLIVLSVPLSATEWQGENWYLSRVGLPMHFTLDRYQNGMDV